MTREKLETMSDRDFNSVLYKNRNQENVKELIAKYTALDEKIQGDIKNNAKQARAGEMATDIFGGALAGSMQEAKELAALKDQIIDLIAE